ncbi:MAG: EthD family reductase [Proteobacteria bacterium]|nr:EthD family reductase [Pseudomonadota bacterium]
MSDALTRRGALALVSAAAGAACATPAFAVGAIKHYIIVELLPGQDQNVLDRWYMTFHSQQVHRAFKAWQRNYVSYRAYTVPPEAAKAYTVNFGRMTEIQFDSLADFRETRPHNIYGELDSYTPPPGGWQGQKLFKSTTATIPVNPQDQFVSLATPPKEIPYFRWIVFFRYPKGVTEEAGDAWYKGVHAKEIARLPGLKRYSLYHTVTEQAPYPHVAEMWFDDYDAWRKAFIAPAPKFTPPPWGGSEPFVDMISMFVGENPDVDFINDRRAIP